MLLCASLFVSFVVFTFFFVFFFKQKTAYELRISDWSSDVCSSDLSTARAPRRRSASRSCAAWRSRPRRASRETLPESRRIRSLRVGMPGGRERADDDTGDCDLRHRDRRGELAGHARSEEHTSELQSLMRISYAVFCLKKKKKKTKKRIHKHYTCKESTSISIKERHKRHT